jgi:MFS transporter, NNP family, nitrate/nitrite transporter
VIFKRKHTWITCWLYLGTFGSFIGYSAGFPLLMQSQFPQANALSYAWLGPLIGALIRPLGGWLADKLGGARVTLWVFAAMAAGVLGVFAFLPLGGESGSFYGFLMMFVLLFAASGIGNGSTYRMIPAIFASQHLRAAAGKGVQAEERALRDANTEAAAVLGFASAIGAYGGFFIPMSYGVSIAMSGTAHAALATFLVFYLVCIATTWWYYARRRAPMPC